MPTATRTLLATACFALAAAAACGGGSPTAPSGAAGATVAGTVHVNGAAAFAPGTNSVSGMTVSVVGTNLSTTVERSGFFQIPDVPAGNVQLQFTDATVNATAALSNVRQQELIEIEVQVAGTSATITSELRSTEKVSLCHNTGTDEYHLISVSVSAEPAHRAHGDGKIGDPVPGETNKTFGENCRVVGPSVRIEKSTNGEDADSAPGPTIDVGSTVNWQYVVTNTGTVDLTNVTVVDDRGVAVSCPGTTLTAGQSMTCTGSGVAVLGQYRNLGTVTASWTSGTVTDSDPSHYYGRAPEDDDEDTAKVQLCHKTGNGSYHLIEVSVSAEPAHRAHGDAKIGEPVPGIPGSVFGVACSVN